MMKKIVYDRSKGEKPRLPCQLCHGKTVHEVLCSINGEESTDYVSTEGEVYEDAYWYKETYQIIQCQGCETISFRSDYDDWGQPDEEDLGGAIDHEELYPSRVAGRNKLEKVHLLPSKVERIYSETHAALCGKIRVLAGVGIRALVEAICKEKGAKGKDLRERIDKLVDIGILTKAGADILHGLRVLGNDAAHEVKPHSEVTLGSAMDVVEHLLVGVYILPKEAENLPKRPKS